ncbi:MAG TPA: hypothetical protein VFO16_08100 [Pseudonocardiaceae bacterium]|nr:hypothetical protein [Pseudonocardiaceae bacterium]
MPKRTRATDHRRAGPARLPALLFARFDTVSPPLAAPLELARHLVWGAVDYASQLGFKSAPDFSLAARHLGPWQQTSAVTFARPGVPFSISAPSTTQPEWSAP